MHPCSNLPIHWGMPVQRLKVGIPIFAYSRQKLVTIATSLELLRKEIRLIMPTHMSTYPENLVTIGPVHSEITGLKGETNH